MKRVLFTNQFKRDYKKSKKSNKKISELEEVIELLREREKLPSKYRDHKLTGNYGNCRECHIEPDWLLIYKTSKES